MTREEQKAGSRGTMKIHWSRCRLIGELLGIPKGNVNLLWTRLFKSVWVPNTDGSTVEHIEPAVAVQLRQAYADHTLQLAEQERRQAAHDRERAEEARRPKPRAPRREPPRRERQEDKPPDLDGRIKIMLWVIKTCGSVELVEDALARARAALEKKT